MNKTLSDIMSKQTYLKKIIDNFPKLKFKKSELITSGYDDVIILDKKIVFSFPKQKLDCPEKFQKELKFLPILNKRITLPIPNFIFIPKDKTFAGYKYIDGVPFSKKILKSLTLKEKESCAKQIAEFINELHGCPVSVAVKNGVGFADPIKNNTKRVVVHQDLIDEHILFNKKTRKISGIIDFGDVQINDLVVEFDRLKTFGKEFLDLILKYYNKTDF